jgi:CDP-paratose 2-epimerase
MRRSKHSVNGNGHRDRTSNASRIDGVVVPRRARKAVLITGGAGFIGTNLADRLLGAGQRVIVYDSLARPGVELNWRWLLEKHGNLVELEEADVRNLGALRAAARAASQVFHFAAQVAVTASLKDPIEDFEVNARGTLNVLEALRQLKEPPPLLFTSTNKVYGELSDVRLVLADGHQAKNRYEPEEAELREFGFGEDRSLSFHSPYGCSKGAACQYVLDYARSFGLPAMVFRMSCVYGPHQCGTEDQGWVAHFLIRALEGKSVTIYGDGRQVRDILYVEDLVDAFILAQRGITRLAGQAFNIGGGPQNTLSLLELLDLIEEIHGGRPEHTFESWRPADQMYYVSDIRKFCQATGWQPRTAATQGVRKVYEWLKSAPGAALARAVAVAREGAGVLADGHHADGQHASRRYGVRRRYDLASRRSRKLAKVG